jgi:hypothetical protein
VPKQSLFLGFARCGVQKQDLFLGSARCRVSKQTLFLGSAHCGMQKIDFVFVLRSVQSGKTKLVFESFSVRDMESRFVL